MKDTLNFREKRASSVIVHRVPPEHVEAFLEWERGIAAAAAAFPGYETTEVYPPADRRRREWVIVIHFEGAEALQGWIDSAERKAWTKNLPPGIGDFQITTLSGGFGAWFAGISGNDVPAPWKMALTVVLALFPVVMVLHVYVGPHLAPLGSSFAMLVSNLMSVSILQWIVMPPLTRLLKPWYGGKSKARVTSVGGAVAILLALLAFAALFHLAIA